MKNVKIKLLKEIDSKLLKVFLNRKISKIEHKIILEGNNLKNNLTFGLLENDKILAICPFTYESVKRKDKKYKIASFYGISLPSLLVSEDINLKEFRLLINIFLQEVEKICLEEKVDYLKLSFSELVDFNLHSEKYQILQRLLIENQYLDVSLIGNRVDLKNNKNLINTFSKGHKAIIKKLNYKIKILKNDEKSFNDHLKDINKIKHYDPHFLYSNKYKKDFRKYQKKGALDILEVLDENNKRIAYGVFTKIKNTIEYYISKNFGENKNAHHALVSGAMHYYQNKGFTYFDLGVIFYGPSLHFSPDEKKINISIFKRGFKGDNYPIIIYEKYFSKDFFLGSQSVKNKEFTKIFKNGK